MKLLWPTVLAWIAATAMAAAQMDRDTPKIGVLWIADASMASPYLGQFKEGLRELGWVDGQTVEIIERYDQGTASRRAGLAAEMVGRGVDVIYAGNPLLPAAMKATATIPIVCPDFYDPVAEGVTKSMARPEGNVTGVSWQSVESAVKRLELARELVPKARRLGMMFDANDPGAVLEAQAVVAAARTANVSLQLMELREAKDVDIALSKLKTSRLQALIVPLSALTWPVIDRIVEGASANRVPLISEPTEFAEAGVVITYGADIYALYRRSAHFVDRILRGAKPADLPIEQPTKFELVVNAKAASAMGVHVPRTLMDRATRVIR
jgi:putative ABC transport system substrate-binding protein